MKRRELKKKILLLLQKDRWPDITVELKQYDEKELIHHLFTALCSTNEICKWHAVSAFGEVVPLMGRKDPEAARIIMRRFLWNLNDESGGIGWGIPEAMAEVMVHDDMLFDEYCHMLISYIREDGPEIYADGNFLELPALQRGVLWGMARLISTRREDMLAREVDKDLGKYLFSGDHLVGGLAALSLGLCGKDFWLDKIQELTRQRASFLLYWNQELEEVTVSALAKEAICKIASSND